MHEAIKRDDVVAYLGFTFVCIRTIVHLVILFNYRSIRCRSGQLGGDDGKECNQSHLRYLSFKSLIRSKCYESDFCVDKGRD